MDLTAMLAGMDGAAAPVEPVAPGTPEPAAPVPEPAAPTPAEPIIPTPPEELEPQPGEPAAPAPPAGEPAAPAAPEPPKMTDAQLEEALMAKFGITGGKSADAFAAQRAQISTYQDFLKRMGTVLGLPNTSDPEALMAGLTENVRAYESQQNNVPVALITQIDEVTAENATMRREMYKNNAFTGFQNVKNIYGLDQTEIDAFATELHDAGINPMLKPVNLPEEYMRLHSTDIIKAAQDAAVTKALARDANTNAHGSAPVAIAGQQQVPAKAGSMAELKQLLNTLK